MRKLVLLFLLCAVTAGAAAQDEQPYVRKGMLILLSTKSYAAARKTALQAAAKLSLKTDFRGLVANRQSGLTYSKKDCENEGGWPCYIARGRYDDGAYISIEYSNAIEGFAKGYYVVIAASGDTSVTTPALAKAQRLYRDAYVKTTNVYIGCMH